MSIRLPFVLNSTPDSVKSKSLSNEKTENKYIWRFRNKTDKGIHIVISPVKLINIDEIEWEINIHNVEWTGNDYNVSESPIESNVQSNFTDAVSCANELVRKVCDNNTDYSHIV